MARLSLTFSQILQICEKVIRRKLVGKQLTAGECFRGQPAKSRAVESGEQIAG
jgi:hypothetical protein